MEIKLILSDDCPHCAEAKKIWCSLCENNAIDIHVMKQGQIDANRIISDKNIKSLPVLMIDGEIRVVGHPTIESAQQFFSEHLSQ
jgi:glutaredoxin